MSIRDERLQTLFAEINAIYDGMASRNGFLTDAEFDAIEAKRAEINRILDSPKPKTPNA